MRVTAAFPCSRVRGNYVQVSDPPTRAASVMITVAEGTSRSTVHIDAAEARRLAIWLLQRAQEISP